MRRGSVSSQWVFVVAAGLALAAVLAAPGGAQQAGKPTAQVTVDCRDNNVANGGGIQDAIDKAKGPVEIRITGFCAEHVVIKKPGVRLVGASGNPSQDGITGRDDAGHDVDLQGDLGLVMVIDTNDHAKGPPEANDEGDVLIDLGIRNSLKIGLLAADGGVGLVDVRVNDNQGTAAHFTSDSFVTTDRLFVDHNGNGVQSNRGALVNCGSCVIDANGGWGVRATSGGQIDLYDAGSGGGPTTISGPRGVAAWYGGRAWLEPGTHVTATNDQALFAIQQGAIESYGAQVDGPIWCGIGGELDFSDLDQTSNSGFNQFYSECTAQFQGGTITLVGTTLVDTHASGALYGGTLNLDDLECNGGGDFVCYGTVNKTSSSCGGCP